MTTTICREFEVSGLESEASSEPLAVLAARAACALERSIQRLVGAGDQNLGHLEAQAAQDVQQLLRQAVERGAQAKADAIPPVCPVCGQPLSRVSSGHSRTFQSRFGVITVRCRAALQTLPQMACAADAAWVWKRALATRRRAGYGGALASKMPVEDASAVLEHLTGVKLPRATLDREARRQGERAQRLAPTGSTSRHPKEPTRTDPRTLPDDHSTGCLEHP